MPTYQPIYTRSPYIVQDATVSDGDTVTFDLYLWNDPASEPTNPTYTEEKVVNSTNISEVNFDLSPYCEEYINHQRFINITSEDDAAVGEYVRVKLIKSKNGTAAAAQYFIGFSGFGYFTEDYNPDLGDVLLDEGTYYYDEDNPRGAIQIYDNQDGASWQIKYTQLGSGLTLATTQNITNEVATFPYVFDSPNFYASGNRVQILKDSVVQKTFTFLPICEPKYTPVVCDFVNRYGAWQTIVFFKASRQKFDAKSDEYNLMSENIDYDIYANRRQTFNMNGRRSITVNTGFVPEGYSDTFKQMLMSKKILLDDVPVKPKTNSIDLQEHINEKLINYELEFEYSHNERNYIV